MGAGSTAWASEKAREAIAAYLTAHIQFLPDGRIWGLGDAAALITAKYIGLPGSHKEAMDLLNLQDPRDFEHLVERAYDRMGYTTQLTPPKKDGGRDVLASRQETGRRERLLIECKRKPSVGVAAVRELLGVVEDENANKGVLVATGAFTKGARDFAARNRLELIDGSRLVPLMNEHLGADWPLYITLWVAESRKASSAEQLT